VTRYTYFRTRLYDCKYCFLYTWTAKGSWM